MRRCLPGAHRGSGGLHPAITGRGGNRPVHHTPGLEDFGDYLDVLEDAQAALEKARLDDMLQLASFHPDYCFEGQEDDDPANYTNRSPYPMFHLIR